MYVGEIISEGSELEFLQMKPAAYNVVLEDGTYKGVLKLGLKFISSVSTHRTSTLVSLSPRRINVILKLNTYVHGDKKNAGEPGAVERLRAVPCAADEADERRGVVRVVSELHAAEDPVEEALLLLLQSLGVEPWTSPEKEV